MNRRNDYKTALLIESIIHEAPMPGAASPARRLAEIGVPFEVAMRVLTRPAERRHQDSDLDERYF
jgi:hypothetical protein